MFEGEMQETLVTVCFDTLKTERRSATKFKFRCPQSLDVYFCLIHLAS